MDRVKRVDAQPGRCETEIDEANMHNQSLVSHVAELEGQLRRNTPHMLGAQDQMRRERDKWREEAAAWRQQVIDAKAESAGATEECTRLQGNATT
jgi:predicted  nucleic acid-binding Zn-ribbon protein